MSTISPTHTDIKDRPHRRRCWPLLVGLALPVLAALAVGVALHSVGRREDTNSFTAAGARELVIVVPPAGSS